MLWNINVFVSGTALCYLYGGNMFMASMFLVSTYNLVFLTLERYYKIIYPFHYMKSFRKWKLHLALFLPWLIGFVHKMVMHLHQYYIGDHKCKSRSNTFYKETAVYGAVWDLLMTFLIPIVIMIFCYARIFVALKKSSKKFKKSPGIGEYGDIHHWLMLCAE